MIATALPPSIADAVERIRATTRELIRASEATEDEAIGRAVEERGGAVEQLRRALERDGDRLDTETRRSMLGSLSLQAHDAGDSLRGLQRRVVDELRLLSEGSQAVKGYAGYSGDPSALDRSG